MSPSSIAQLRIDELAQRSGIPSGTIRFYQREGLIPPPRREGRVAYYSEEHLERLQRVRGLQAQGLPLSLVGDLIAREDAGEDVAGWLALDTAVLGSHGGGEPVDEAALEALGLAPDDVAALERAGVMRRDEEGALVALPGMLELTARLLDGGVAPEAIRAGAELVTSRLGDIAETMATLGWETFAPERRRISSREPVADEVLDKFEHLRSLAQRIVGTLFREQLDEAIKARSEPFAVETVQRSGGGRRRQR